MSITDFSRLVARPLSIELFLFNVDRHATGTRIQPQEVHDLTAEGSAAL